MHDHVKLLEILVRDSPAPAFTVLEGYRGMGPTGTPCKKGIVLRAFRTLIYWWSDPGVRWAMRERELKPVLSTPTSEDTQVNFVGVVSRDGITHRSALEAALLYHGARLALCPASLGAPDAALRWVLLEDD